MAIAATGDAILSLRSSFRCVKNHPYSVLDSLEPDSISTHKQI